MNIAMISPIDLRKHRWRLVESIFLRATTSRQRQYIFSCLLRRLFDNRHVSLLCSQGSFNSYIICIHTREECLASLVFSFSNQMSEPEARVRFFFWPYSIWPMKVEFLNSLQVKGENMLTRILHGLSTSLMWQIRVQAFLVWRKQKTPNCWMN